MVFLLITFLHFTSHHTYYFNWDAPDIQSNSQLSKVGYGLGDDVLFSAQQLGPNGKIIAFNSSGNNAQFLSGKN
jgi:hypothetical protein